MKKFKKVSILGVGLIGGSIGLALKQRNLADRITGLTTKKSSLNKALDKGAIDDGSLSLKKATEDADLIIVCTPVGNIPHIVNLIGPFVRDNSIITDVGSTKKEIVDKAEKFLPKNVHFVGGHPMAGSEKRGVEAANADLFKNSVCILTKDNRTHTASFKKIEDLWKQLGAKVRILSASDHDDIVARVSHLPHLAAVALVNQIKQKDIDFISTGFKDTTRIAKSDPDIWKDIYVSNKKEIIDSLNKYIKFLERLRDRISTVDTKGLRQELKKVQDLRKKI